MEWVKLPKFKKDDRQTPYHGFTFKRRGRDIFCYIGIPLEAFNLWVQHKKIYRFIFEDAETGKQLNAFEMILPVLKSSDTYLNRKKGLIRAEIYKGFLGLSKEAKPLGSLEEEHQDVVNVIREAELAKMEAWANAELMRLN